MYTKRRAKLQMQKPLLGNLELDSNVYSCEVLEYDEVNANILLCLDGREIQSLILDAFYDCRILLEEKEACCTGVIRERYMDQKGYMLRLDIESGFYEINIK
jgi:hypothetical protein